ncbi:hypothetical protein [Halostagnicola larsenii]|uniref:hypothetical protein n=1 Tax=Halostagnicola larsenii TaxID=353800 RepID=UPI0012FC122C|nr:hypothetical protein [Halostagnicola larsenii]
MVDITRRSCIKSIGGIVSLATVANTSVAAQDSESNFREQLDQLISHGRTDEAKDLLESHDLKYDMHKNEYSILNSTTPEDSTSNSTNSGGVSTQDFYNYGDSTIEYTLSELPSGKYLANINWVLKEDDNALHGAERPYPKDGVAIAWEDSQWGYVDESIDRLNIQYWYDEPGGDFNNAERVEENTPELKSGPFMEPANSVGILVDDRGHLGIDADEMRGHLSLKLRKQDSHIGSVGMNYSHNWTPAHKEVGNIIGSVDFSGKVSSISVSVPSGADKWSNSKGREVLES